LWNKQGVRTIGAHGLGSFDKITRGDRTYWRFRIRINGKTHERTASTRLALEEAASRLRASASMTSADADRVARSTDIPSETDLNGRQFVRLTDEAFREWIYERDRGICGICGEPVAFSDHHIDHIRPRREGGNDTVGNLRISHPRCNLRRGAERQLPIYLA
jgi:hypothetical protein